MSDTDLELLQRYTRDRAEDAFAEIVHRHLDLVHSAALRQVRSPQLAEEVAQSAFTDLARNAHRLAADTILSAWLYQVARRTAIDVVRREARRQLREQIATEMNAMNATTADWTHIEPLLDEAMHALEETDRAAILLRYFENKSLREVGATLGTSDDAAQKRVSRAVERLREFFAKRGVTVGAGGLVVVISANAVQAAPAGLAVTISTAAALAGTTIATTATATAIKAIAMTTLQKTIIGATLAAAVGAGVYEARQASILRSQVQTLQQQQAPLAEQIQQLNESLVAATNQIAGLRNDNERLNRNTGELLKLRGEVTRLRRDATEPNDPAQTAAKSWLNRLNQLKERLAKTPEANIPELKLLEEEDWLAAVKDRHLDSDVEYRRALSALRQAGESKVASVLQKALTEYLKNNGKQFPTELTQLRPYFSSPIDDAVLQRWEIASAKKISTLGFSGDWIITQKNAVDDVFDTQFGIGPDGWGSTTFLISQTRPIMDSVYNAFQAANNGEFPADKSQLLPYATTPEQQSALQKLILRDTTLR